MMKRFLATWVLLVVPTSFFAQQGKPEATAQQKFAAGGTVHLHLESGGYTIAPTDAEEISVSCRARTDRQLSQVKVRIKAAGNRADVYVGNTPNNNFNATIEIPRRSHLWARLTAGELVVGVLEGDKDLELNAGRVEVDIPRPQDYGSRDASVTTGSIQASAFEVFKGGLFRSFHQQGPGRYRLRVHVIAGEINLRNSI
jgi:hypothetical protein